VDATGNVIVERMPAQDYAKYIGEATVPHSFLKSPYFKPLGFPDGNYRVGPLARLNVAARCGTPQADVEFDEYHQRFGKVVQSSFHFHYARLIEIIYSLERMETLLNDPGILGRHVRAHAGVNALEGVGMAEAPRGVLMHHYKVNEDGAMVWANLIIATGHNNMSIGDSIKQVSQHFVDGKKMKEGMLNRVSAVLRAYDPCLSCSTHADNPYGVEIQLVDHDGAVVDSIKK
jgi:NAD-reducing hydrogenase large subunit